MKKSIVIIGSFILGIVVFQSCGNNNSTNTDTKTDTSTTQTKDNMTTTNPMNNDMMNAMHKSMKEMKMTGDFDEDFANTMIQHHQEAIDMSEVEVAKGNDAQVKGWAGNIITAQKAEIGQFQQVLKNYKSSGQKMGENHNELKEAMDKMMNDMMTMKMMGKMDQDFVMMMVKHHETAITMAKDEISKGKNSELKKMAQKIVEDQGKEIKEFQTWLDRNK